MSSSNGGICVLAIDDEAALLDFLSYSLPKRGYHVTTAASGHEGLEKAREKPFDLVICDIMMPELSGIQVLAELKKFSPDSEVIMATAHATLETAIEAMKLGAYDYITKPYNLNQLCLIFERALERRRLKTRIVDLEELDRLKSQFLATTSHELRTPLNAIIGFHSLLLHNIFGPLQPEQADAIQRADQGTKHLLRLVTNILDTSKLAAGKMETLIQTCDVAKIAQEVIEELEPLKLEKNLYLRYEGPPSCEWATDRDRVWQILINLVSNAIKFTSAGGVTVRLERRGNAGDLLMSVIDTGIGIKAEDIPIIFQDFKQLDGSSTRRYGGTGLGLSICKQMAELLGGRIEVESRFGEGSTFSVVLPSNKPMAAPAPEAAPAPQTPFGVTGSGTILVADDDADARRVLKATLSSAGYRVVEAKDGMETLRMVDRERPDLILLDMSMPELTGWEVAQRLRENPSMASLKIVAHTAHASGGDAAKALKAGCDDHITKPCAPEEILRRVAKQLQPQPK